MFAYFVLTVVALAFVACMFAWWRVEQRIADVQLDLADIAAALDDAENVDAGMPTWEETNRTRGGSAIQYADSGDYTYLPSKQTGG